MGPQVPLVDSGESVAREVQRRLRAGGLENRRPAGGTLRCFTTDNPQRFEQLSERFGGRQVRDVELVGTDELRDFSLPKRFAEDESPR